MPLVVHPIIYTSFPKVGFQSLASPSVPIEVQQTFLEQIVYQQWNTYDPPPAGYRAVYLYQVTPEQLLFGWLYNDGNDDLGRSNIPYFVGYHFQGRINSSSLEQILNCLELGPPVVFDRQNPPKLLENLVIPDGNSYQPTRRGLSLDSETRQKIHRNWQQQQLIRLFVALKMPDPTTYLKSPLESSPLPQIPNNYLSTTPSSPLTQLLEGFMQKPIGIQGVVLISREGHLMSDPVGMDEETATLIGGRMLYLAQSTQDELNWQDIENISIRAKDGHLILTRCDADSFLLVKTGKALTGLLEAEINRFLKQLQPTLDKLDSLDSDSMSDEDESVFSRSRPLPNLEHQVKEMIYESNFDDLEDDDEISYRGRKLT